MKEHIFGKHKTQEQAMGSGQRTGLEPSARPSASQLVLCYRHSTFLSNFPQGSQLHPSSYARTGEAGPLKSDMVMTSFHTKRSKNWYSALWMYVWRPNTTLIQTDYELKGKCVPPKDIKILAQTMQDHPPTTPGPSKGTHSEGSCWWSALSP